MGDEKKGAMTVREVALDLGVSEDTVRRWIAQKKLPALELVGSKDQSIWRILRADYNRFIQGAKRA